MANRGTIIIVTVASALVLFVVLAVAPFISGSDDHYKLNNNGIKSSSIVIDDAVIVTEEIPEAVSEDEEQTSVEAPVVVETEQTVIPDVTEITESVEAVAEPLTDQVETALQDTETKVAAASQVHIVTAQGLKYESLVINIAVGDSVAWENMSSHDTQSMEGLIPAEAEHWHSAMGENYQHTFAAEGIYVYKCTPHFGAGMGGVVIVGNPVNLEQIKAAKVKGASKRLVKKAIKAAEAM